MEAIITIDYNDMAVFPANRCLCSISDDIPYRVR